MQDFVAYASRQRIALLVLGCVAFVLAGLWMIGAFGPALDSDRYPPAVMAAIGWASIVFFGFGGVVWTTKLFDTREPLRIGVAGVHARAWSDQTIPWSEIVDVTIWTYARQKSIVLHLRDPARYPGRGLAALLGGTNRKLTGGDISLTVVGTDRSFDEALSAIAQFGRTGGEAAAA